MYGGNWCSKETTKETLIGQGRNMKQSNPNMCLKICLDCEVVCYDGLSTLFMTSTCDTINICFEAYF
jgi:hypothetical protein